MLYILFNIFCDGQIFGRVWYHNQTWRRWILQGHLQGDSIFKHISWFRFDLQRCEIIDTRFAKARGELSASNSICVHVKARDLLTSPEKRSKMATALDNGYGRRLRFICGGIIGFCDWGLDVEPWNDTNKYVLDVCALI